MFHASRKQKRGSVTCAFLVAVAALAPCGLTVADVRVFVTSSADGWGLDLLGPQGDGTGTDPAHEDWPIDPFRPTYSTVDINGNDYYGYDYYFGYYRAAAYPPIDAPSGTVDNPILIDAAAGEIGYMWFQFRGEPIGAQVNGFMCSVRLPEGDPADDLSLTYYVQNDQSGSGKKRFDGPALPPDYYGWHNNPFITDQVQSNSIRNHADDPTLMFEHQAFDGGVATGVALLGALTGGPGSELYEFKIDQIDYSVWPWSPTVGESSFFRIVPEPGRAALLPIGVMLIGARRR